VTPVLIIGTFLILFALKLLGVLAVSWWVVTLPLWLPPLAILVFFLILFATTRDL
jgi:hypothetical protein